MDRFEQIESLLRQHTALSSRDIARELGVSQPTLSRLLGAAGERIVRIGRARAARYALAYTMARAGNRWPLYRIDAHGRAQSLGELRALERDAFHFEPSRALPAFVHGEFAEGLYPGLPWFLDDQRPQGFLGRAFAQRYAADIGASTDILRWRNDDIVLGLLRHGEDEPGDLVLGEASLQRARQAIAQPREAICLGERTLRYPALAEAALRGEAIGSSAAGEQPKFAVTLRDGKHWSPVIVKFSERAASPAGRRWADLLICEHLAGVTLREHGLPAAESDIVEAGGRVFLQSARFDRTAQLGRRGFVSLAALAAAFHGHGYIQWWRYADELRRDGWLSTPDAQRLRRIGWFGALIANADMHLGNAALQLADTRPLALAPAYDMLPMQYRPAASGEIFTREYTILWPTPEQRDDWLAAAAPALSFWRSASTDARISRAFRAIAKNAANQLAQAIDRA